MNRGTPKILTKLPVILTGIYICIFLSLLICTVFTNAPRELRDAANVAAAQRLAHMQNPYILDVNQHFIEYINVYPPLNMLLAAFLHLLTGSNLYKVFYALDFIYIVITATVIACFIKKNFNTSLFVTLLSFSASLTLGWRTGFISTVPDHLGMLICIILLLCVHKNKSILLQAVLSILAFYSKQYFLAIAATVFLFYCLRNKITALKYFLYTAAIGISSFIIICIVCPSFSVQILYFMFAENDSMNISKILYSVKQIFLVFTTYAFYSLFTFKKYILGLKKLIADKRVDTTVFDLNNILMFFVLLYLGTNKGAFLSYHLTLLMPCIIITGSVELDNFLKKLTYKRKLSLTFFICIGSLALLLKKYQLPYVYTEKDYSQYVHIENILEQYKKHEVYLVSQLGYYALEHSKALAENGHHDYIISLSESHIINTSIDINESSRLFPYIRDLYKYSLLRKEEILDSIDKQEFALITRQNGNTMLYGYDIRTKYVCIDSIPIRTGTQNYTVDLWVPKE